MKYLKYFFFSAFTFILACTQPPDYPDEPVIEFLSLSKSVMLQGSINTDTFLLTMSFTDGDGDIGDNDSLNVFFTDTRDGADFLKYRIPFVNEQGTGNGISGEIAVTLESSCCIHPDPNVSIACPEFPSEMPTETDTLIYEIYILDRAGNQSNVIQTDPIILICD